MPYKRILLFHEDPSLQPYLEKHLDAHKELISIQNTQRAKRRIVNQPFPFIIVEARKNWYRDLQRSRRLNGNVGNTTILVAPSSFIQNHTDCLKALSLAALGRINSQGSTGTLEQPSEDLCLKDFVERKLKDFVKHMKVGRVRNLYSVLLAEVEHPLFTYILKETKGNQMQAAKLLGMNRNTLRKKIKALKINYKQPRAALSRI
jgi:two-component system, NtrC family, nitrogen regulation response regulator GlnG